MADLAVEGAEESLAMIKGVLGNQAGPARDIVVLNAGAAIYAAGVVSSWKDGVDKAQAVIAEGAALEKFNRFVTITNNF